MSTKPNSMAPFSPSTHAVRTRKGPPGMAVAVDGTWGRLNTYIANAAEPEFADVGDILYVPAFQMVEREEPGAPLEPQVGFTWVHDGVTRVILEVRDDGRVGFASNASGRRFQVYSATLEHLASAGYPTKPGRKIREWQPTNRVSGP